MPQPTPVSTELLSHYSRRLTADLERIQERQQQVLAELEDLRSTLGTLQHDRALLDALLQALDTDSAALSGRGEPSLVSLIRAHLAQAEGTCSTGEVTAALARQTPERKFKVTVVRTTLEHLVSRGEAERFKDGHAVRYAPPR